MFPFVRFKRSKLSQTVKRINILALMLVLVSIGPSLARDVSFTWTSNNDDPAVDGYRLYYKTGDPGTSLSDYDGVDAGGGNPSPLEITGQSSNSYTLLNLHDDSGYSFILTSYRGTEESEPTTPLTLAASTSTEDVRSASFSWLANTDDPPVDGYYLYYKVGDPGTSLADYTGTDVSGGNPSPVEISGQGNTFYTLNNLSKTKTYSFVLTAYRGSQKSEPTQPVTLGTANSPPVASDESIAISENQQYTGQLSATDPDGDALTYSIVTNCTKGNAVITNSSTGAFTYMPDPGVSGSGLFTFKVNDGGLDSDVASVNITISGTNVPPAASNSTINVSEDTVYNGQLNGSDPDGDPITYSIVSNGTKGSAILVDPSTGSFTYEPDTNENGSDSFTFVVNDGSVNSPMATVSVSISAINDAPLAESAAITVSEDGQYEGMLTGTDVDGDSLTYSLASGSSKGTVIIVDPTTGAFTYSPDANATGSDSFFFKVHDGSLGSSSAEVAITINGENDAPVANNGAFTVDEDVTYTGQLAGHDSDGDTLTYSVVSNGSLGEAVIINPADGSFTYTPINDENGDDVFTFAVSDGNSSSAAATVSVSINPVNDEPIVQDLNIDTVEDMAYSGQLSANDPDGDVLVYTIVSDPLQGTVIIDNYQTGEFTYTPNDGATGSDTFSFMVHDGVANSEEGRVNVTFNSADTLISVFGNATDSDYPGTMEDTFANLNTDINSASDTLNLYSWSSTIPHKVANTILIKVDLSAIPHYATIVDARLQLYLSNGHGAVDYTTSVHKVTGKNPILNQVNGYNAFNGEPWTSVPTGTTYNDIPMGLADIDSLADSVIVTPESGYVSWSVTDMVQEWVKDSAANKGLMIKGEDNSTETGRYFFSSESQSADFRPKLILRYTVKPPPPQLILVEEVR